jgi:hypothetical protein
LKNEKKEEARMGVSITWSASSVTLFENRSQISTLWRKSLYLQPDSVDSSG